MLKCSKCGKVLEGKKGTKVIGLKIEVQWNSVDILTNPTTRLLLHSLGPYTQYLECDDSLGKSKVEFSFCYECWLDSLFGAKPVKETL